MIEGNGGNMFDRTRKHGNFMRGVLASILAALVITGINYLLAPAIKDPLLANFVAGLLGATAVLLAIKWRVLNVLELIGAKYLGAHTGIVQVYPSLHYAFEDLRASCSRAKRIDLLLHIGRREFGTKDALFSDLLRGRAGSDEELEVRILHIDEKSPHLSEEKAKRLGKRRDTWLRHVRYVRAQIQEICDSHSNIRLASHCEPYVWRLFFFDDELFVSGYLYSTHNDEQAPVYRIKAGGNSLYTAFRSHFDHLWRRYSEGSDASQVPAQQVPAADALRR